VQDSELRLSGDEGDFGALGSLVVDDAKVVVSGGEEPGMVKSVFTGIDADNGGGEE
jgi:hypothetical protein